MISYGRQCLSNLQLFCYFDDAQYFTTSMAKQTKEQTKDYIVVILGAQSEYIIRHTVTFYKFLIIICVPSRKSSGNVRNMINIAIKSRYSLVNGNVVFNILIQSNIFLIQGSHFTSHILYKKRERNSFSFVMQGLFIAYFNSKTNMIYFTQYGLSMVPSFFFDLVIRMVVTAFWFPSYSAF